MAIISQKQTLATVNSLKVVKIILSKIWKFYHAPTSLPNSGWLVQQNNPSQANIPFMLKPSGWFAR